MSILAKLLNCFYLVIAAERQRGSTLFLTSPESTRSILPRDLCIVEISICGFLSVNFSGVIIKEKVIL